MLPASLAPKLDPLIRRLATNHDGERLATVAALERTLAAAQADFHDLADVVVAGVKPRAEHRASPHRHWRPTPDAAAMLADLLGHPDLSAWERDFVESVYGQYRRRWRLSDRQLQVLEGIWRKVAT
jgi:hypothetical protein